MKLKDLYSKPIYRTVNPAVSATKFDPETERIEIQEYVFTDEIINGLFRILNAIKNNKPYDHVGIWIDGYYGSGKSHFLKYLDYCITPHTRDDAMSRLLEAVKAIDPLDDKHNISFDYEQLLSIANWLKRATIDTCIFNLETSYDNSTDKKKAFLHIFWNEFNGKRGFNKFNLTLAQNLEKPLWEKGVFEQFKERIEEEGGDWNDPGMAADMIDNELGMVLDIACELAPSLDKESIRQRIINRDTNISIDRFASELASYLKDKGDDYRLILLADEVSQFINKERDRYLNLQEIEKSIRHCIRPGIIGTGGSQSAEYVVRFQTHFVNIRAYIDLLLSAFRSLGDQDFFLSHKGDYFIFPVFAWSCPISEPHTIVRRGYERHGVPCLTISHLPDSGNMNTFCHDFVQALTDLLGGNVFRKFQVKVFTFTLHTDPQRGSEGHDHVRTVAAGKGSRQSSSSYRFLKIAHRVKVSDKFDRALFTEFDPNLHNRHLLHISGSRSRSIAAGSWALRFLLPTASTPGAESFLSPLHR